MIEPERETPANANPTDDGLIPFIDTHHHLWDMSEFTPGWIHDDGEGSLFEDYSPIRRPYEIEDLLADFRGSHVIRSVHVQTGYTDDVDPVKETGWLQRIADSHGFPHGIVAYADLASPSVGDDLDRHREFSNIRGVRNFVQGEKLLEVGFERGLTALMERGLIYDLASDWTGLAGARRMAGRFPDLQVILGHAGSPMGRTADYLRNWEREMQNLALAPNVAVKISGLGIGDQSWTVESIRPLVRSIIEIFGTERCMFGTNWPVDKLVSSYQTVVDAYREIISDLSVAEQEALLWKNADKFYKLD